MRARTGCCERWPKPCSYHEGWADADDWWRDHLHGEEGIDWERGDAPSVETPG